MSNLSEAVIMVSRLPLLFTNGEPRNLDRIELYELEEFFNFVLVSSVNISVGNLPHHMNQLSRPEWWPQELPFRLPVCKDGNPDERLRLIKRLVCLCYTFHDCEYSLKLSAELAERPNELIYQEDLTDNTVVISGLDGHVLVTCCTANFKYDTRPERTPMTTRSSLPMLTKYGKTSPQTSPMMTRRALPTLTKYDTRAQSAPMATRPSLPTLMKYHKTRAQTTQMRTRHALPTLTRYNTRAQTSPMRTRHGLPMLTKYVKPKEQLHQATSMTTRLGLPTLTKYETPNSQMTPMTTRFSLPTLTKYEKPKSQDTSMTTRFPLPTLTKYEKPKSQDTPLTTRFPLPTLTKYEKPKPQATSMTTRFRLPTLTKYDNSKAENTSMTTRVPLPTLTIIEPEKFDPLNDFVIDSSGDERGEEYSEECMYYDKIEINNERFLTVENEVTKHDVDNGFSRKDRQDEEFSEESIYYEQMEIKDDNFLTLKDEVVTNYDVDNGFSRRDRQDEESACMSKCLLASSSKESAKKKLLFENLRRKDPKPNNNNYESQPDNTSKKRKTNIQLPIIRKKRLFEDFPEEQVEPDVLDKEGFLSRLLLGPHQKVPLKLGHKIQGKKKLSKSFSFVMLTSIRGQAILAKNDRFNMTASLDRNNKFCGTHQQEEEHNHICTRSSNSSLAFKAEALIPDNASAYAKGHIHSYKWPRRGRKVVYPQKGPTVKECSVKLTKLSEHTIQSLNKKKCNKVIMPLGDLEVNNVSICDCQKIPLIILDDDESASKVKDQSSSTRCKCIRPKRTFKFRANSYQNKDANSKAIISSEVAVKCHHKIDIDNIPLKITSTSSTIKTEPINLPILSERESLGGFCVTQSEPLLTHAKRVFHRRPLLPVLPEPIIIIDDIDDESSQCITYVPNANSTSSSIKLNNFFRSMSDAIKWYTKDEPLEQSDCLRESHVKEEVMFGTNRSQENIKPFTEIVLPGSKKPIDYFKMGVDLSERDYCFERSSGGASKLVTRRGERHYINREPCPSCFQGKDNFCVYEFIRQAKLAGATLCKSSKQLKVLFFKFIQTLNIKE